MFQSRIAQHIDDGDDDDNDDDVCKWIHTRSHTLL